VSPCEFVIPGYTQRQIQLESRAFRQFGSDLGAPVGSLGDQELISVRWLRNELRVTPVEGRDLSSRQTQYVVKDLEIGKPINSNKCSEAADGVALDIARAARPVAMRN
jgi:hypothetical protein